MLKYMYQTKGKVDMKNEICPAIEGIGGMTDLEELA